MAESIKVSVFDVNIFSQENIFLSGKSLDHLLKELASNLDEEDCKKSRILSVSGNKETSIWFDSFDEIREFSDEPIFNNTICFLLAKDMNYQFRENKETDQIENIVSDEKIRPKIPAHCVFLKDENVLLMEKTSQTPTVSKLKTGITNSSHFAIKNEHLEFKPRYRKDVIERLNNFIDKIESVEILDLNIEKYLKASEDTDGYIQNLLLDPRTKLKAKLEIHAEDWRSKTVDFFTDLFNKQKPLEMQDIKITYKEERDEKEIASLYENFAYLKIEGNLYFDDVSDLNRVDRLGYSQNVYKTMIMAYNEENN